MTVDEVEPWGWSGNDVSSQNKRQILLHIHEKTSTNNLNNDVTAWGGEIKRINTSVAMSDGAA